MIFSNYANLNYSEEKMKKIREKLLKEKNATMSFFF